MKKKGNNLDNERYSWKLLRNHYQKISQLHLREMFFQDPNRGERMVIEDSGIYFDYSKHRITDETMELLIQLAEESKLRDAIKAMFRGEKINATENRSVLHIALRAPKGKSIIVDGENVVPKVHDVLDRMVDFSNKIRNRQWKGYTGKPIRNIVNIGIGGSDLGPAMVYEALRYYSERNLGFHFISNIDSTDFTENVRDLDPQETLFIVSSKSFTTLETMTNAYTARSWVLHQLRDLESIPKHFVAVSTNIPKVKEFGILSENTFKFWDWVGGRYSLCSAIGLSTMIAIGPENFYAMLKGFHQIDEHFYNTPLNKNIPVVMALLGIWYNNFFNSQTVAVLPYNQYLKRFPAYLQQLTMESNGKNMTIDGSEAPYQTGPIYWGEPGTNGQHSFFQLIHQGTKLIPCDFITFFRSLNPPDYHHNLLIANVLAQAEALAFGKTAQEAQKEGIPEHLIPYRIFKGNRPSSMIIMDKLTPSTLGKLIALYEHSVFTQGVIWKINSFDQWGVELGKTSAEKILIEINSKFLPNLQHDSSTNDLIKIYRKSIGK